MDIKKLKDQIWKTRISRVNAEKRLLKKNSFIQGINIYYSILMIAFSISSYIYKNDVLSIMTIYLSISLIISILYLDSQSYADRALQYRKNYTELQRLEYALSHLKESNIDEIKIIEEKYCNLLNVSENHISYDFYKTIKYSKPDYKNEYWRGIKCEYYWNLIWRFLLKLIIIILPFILLLFCGEFNAGI